MRTRGGMALLAAVLVLALAGAAEAQIVNVQSQIGEVPEGFSGQIDAAADYRTGNVDLLLLTGALTVRYKHDDHLVFMVLKGEYGELGDPGTNFLKHSFEHVRYRFKLNARLTLEAFAQHEFDQFRRMQLRALVGAGPRITVLDQPNLAVTIGVAYLLEHEELDERMGATDAGDTFTDHRISSYAVISAKVNDKVTFSETVYAQPKITDPGDVRLLSEMALLVKLTDKFTFKTAFVLAHDSNPPDLLDDTDTVLISGISFKF
jgi:putative salt-induced outer membrane protein YdiY